VDTKHKKAETGQKYGKGQRRMERKKEAADTWRGFKEDGEIVETGNKHGRIYRKLEKKHLEGDMLYLL
jgi:hypothetical protein